MAGLWGYEMAREMYTRIDADSYEYRTTLDGQDYLVRLSWSTRGEQWILTLSDVDGNHLGSAPLVLYQPLFARFQRDNLPAGEIMLVSAEAGLSPIARDELGSRGRLVYLEVVE